MTRARPRVRSLTSHRDFEQCVAIQKKVWQHSDHDLTPAHQLCIAVETGGILLGAFVDHCLAGFAYSFPALFEGRLCQHSHLLAVLPEYQGYGLGKLLKWAQRSRALGLGYDLITWTYDPLQIRNAGLNLHTLGAESRTYMPNFYGSVASLVFAENVPSDRLKVEWALKSRRVEDRRRGVYPGYDLAREVMILEGRLRNGRLEPGPVRPAGPSRRALVEIPRDLKGYRRQPEHILAWQSALRRALSRSFGRGWRLTDFIFGPRCFYVLEKASPAPRTRR